eukprot:825023-Ditylum_brightwellii.AAC.1
MHEVKLFANETPMRTSHTSSRKRRKRRSHRTLLRCPTDCLTRSQAIANKTGFRHCRTILDALRE